MHLAENERLLRSPATINEELSTETFAKLVFALWRPTWADIDAEELERQSRLGEVAGTSLLRSVESQDGRVEIYDSVEHPAVEYLHPSAYHFARESFSLGKTNKLPRRAANISYRTKKANALFSLIAFPYMPSLVIAECGLDADGPSSKLVNFLTPILGRLDLGNNVRWLGLFFIAKLSYTLVTRLTRSQPNSEIRVAVIALMLAAKILDDHTYNNASWSNVTGIHQTEISRMELEFLGSLRFEVHAPVEVFDGWKDHVKYMFHDIWERERAATLRESMLHTIEKPEARMYQQDAYVRNYWKEQRKFAHQWHAAPTREWSIQNHNEDARETSGNAESLYYAPDKYAHRNPYEKKSYASACVDRQNRPAPPLQQVLPSQSHAQMQAQQRVSPLFTEDLVQQNLQSINQLSSTSFNINSAQQSASHYGAYLRSVISPSDTRNDTFNAINQSSQASASFTQAYHTSTQQSLIQPQQQTTGFDLGSYLRSAMSPRRTQQAAPQRSVFDDCLKGVQTTPISQGTAYPPLPQGLQAQQQQQAHYDEYVRQMVSPSHMPRPYAATYADVPPPPPGLGPFHRTRTSPEYTVEPPKQARSSFCVPRAGDLTVAPPVKVDGPLVDLDLDLNLELDLDRIPVTSPADPFNQWSGIWESKFNASASGDRPKVSAFADWPVTREPNDAALREAWNKPRMMPPTALPYQVGSYKSPTPQRMQATYTATSSWDQERRIRSFQRPDRFGDLKNSSRKMSDYEPTPASPAFATTSTQSYMPRASTNCVSVDQTEHLSSGKPYTTLADLLSGAVPIDLSNFSPQTRTNARMALTELGALPDEQGKTRVEWAKARELKVGEGCGLKANNLNHALGVALTWGGWG